MKVAKNRGNRFCVFLDRDGVLNPDTSYPVETKNAVLYPDVVPALQRMQYAGFKPIVVTNQSGVSRGYFTIDDVHRFNEELRQKLAKHNILMSGRDFYICPHGNDDNCDCKKPAPGLILNAAKDNSIVLAKSFMIGDKERDVLAGKRAGTHTILLARFQKISESHAEVIVPDLIRAAEIMEKYVNVHEI